MTGIVTDIQRYSLHDGPGVRTSVFLKGCNMRCAWCHNPETISFEPEYLINPEKCIGCGQCDDGCFADARILCGKEMTVGEVADVVLLDRDYYGAEGGVTVTGGEPTCQADFTAAVLAECKRQGIHTALETNLLCPWESLEKIIPHLSLIMADMKLFDPALHVKWTNAGNQRVKENFRMRSEAGVPLIMRTPIIPGVNDDAAEISAIASFASELDSLLYYELLPYHSLGLSKGRPEKSDWVQPKFEKPEPEVLRVLSEAAAQNCAKVLVANKKIS